MTSKRHYKLYLLAAMMLLLSVVMIACGDNTATPAPAATTAAATSAAATTAAATTAAATTAAATTAAATSAAAATTAGTNAAATTVATATTAAAGGSQAGKPLVVGMITSRTGPLSYYGDMLEKGFNIGLDYFTKGTNTIQGRQVKLMVEDDAGDANKAVDAARKLVQQDGAEILVGTPSSTSALAIAAVNDKDLKKIFIVDPAASPDLTGAKYSQYTFHTGRNTDQDAATGAAFAATTLATKTKKIASIYQDNAFGQGSDASWKEIATKTPGVQWIQIAVPATATDFTPYLQKALDAAPDVLLVSWAGTTSAKLYQQMKDNDIFSKMTVTGGVGDTATIKSLGDASLGFQGMMVYWYQFPKTAENDYLVKQYKDKYNSVPDLFSPGGFSAASALYTALTKTGGDATPDKMIPAMEGMSFPTPKGTMTFRKEDHQALQPMYIVKMVKDTTGTFSFPIPSLVKEVSAEESAPPIRNKK
ncbi:MAG TPA: substrate-binding domain-containing protein [Chloroflexia bacterium]|nr:substrate-binding domain-containing protein [Chloroflexia bacterium]